MKVAFQPGCEKLLVVKTIKEGLGIGLKEAKDMADFGCIECTAKQYPELVRKLNTAGAYDFKVIEVDPVVTPDGNTVLNLNEDLVKFLGIEYTIDEISVKGISKILLEQTSEDSMSGLLAISIKLALKRKS